MVSSEGDRISYLEARQKQLLRICEIQSRVARANFDLDHFMQLVVDLLKDLIGADGVVVELVEGEEMVYRAIDAAHARSLGLRLNRAGSLSGLCIEQRAVLHCPDSELDSRVDRDACRAVGLRAMICAPLMEEDRPVGALKAFSAAPDTFSDDDVATLMLMADTLGAALAKRLAFHHRQVLLAEREEALAKLSQARDAAEEKARRAALAEAIAGLGHWRYDIARRESYWSPLMFDLHGVPNGKPPPAEAVVAMIHPDDREMVGRHLREGLERGVGGERIVFRLHRPDGVLRRLEASTTVEVDAGGAPVALVGVVRDVSENHAKEVALREARRLAESAARVKADFLANMTHELRTPLTAVLGFSRLIDKQADLGAETRLHIGRVLSAGEALMFTINDLLDFSKLEAGQVEIRPRPMSPEVVVRQAVDLLSAKAAEKRIGLDVEIDPAAPPWVFADPDRLRQILLNLVGNALKFTDQGGVTVRLRCVEQAQWLEISVSDTGTGVSPENLERLFRRFAQIDGGQSLDLRGTGLGLAICKGLVETMGGSIGVDSQLGVGSRFWFRLPLRVAPPVLQATKEDDIALVAGRRVLVADDNPANRILARSILQTFDAHVAEAEDGLQAVEMAGLDDYDVVLMDLRMPALDGAAAARRIQGAGGPRSGVPILAFSADRDVDLQGGLFHGVVAKPIEPQALLLAVARGCRARDLETPGIA